MKIKTFIFFIVLTLSACSQTPTIEHQVIEKIPTNPEVSQRAVTQENKEIMPNAPDYRPIRLENVDAIHVPTGSLFNSDNIVSLYQLHKKFSVGDMIMIELDESTSAKKSLKYQSDKSSKFELGPLSISAGTIQIDKDDLNIQHNQENEFDASASSKQSNTLNGSITVFVMEILPNRNLLVAGEKWIILNTGQEYIRFSGEIRTADIDVSNTISSAKVGNARIEYSGKGELHENQQDSMLDKLFAVFK